MKRNKSRKIHKISFRIRSVKKKKLFRSKSKFP